jgi:hypothetical protein
MQDRGWHRSLLTLFGGSRPKVDGVAELSALRNLLPRCTDVIERLAVASGKFGSRNGRRRLPEISRIPRTLALKQKQAHP